MKKKNRSFEELEKTVEFEEELLMLQAHTLLQRLFEKCDMDEVKLADILGTSEENVHTLLTEDCNMTLKILANVCFLLNIRIKLPEV